MYKRLTSVGEAAEQVMNEWSDDESNAVDMVILPPDNFDLLTDNEEVQYDYVMIDNGLPSNFCGTVQVFFFSFSMRRTMMIPEFG